MMVTKLAPSAGPVGHRRFTMVGRQRFSYFTWGSSGPPVVLVHGTGFHGYVWKPIAQALSADFHVFAIDQRGHGDSAKPEHGYDWDCFASDLYEFLEVQQLQYVTAVGHSAGATAIAFCAASHPRRIARAVLIDPILLPAIPPGQAPESLVAQRARKRRMVWESRTSMFHSYRIRPPFNTWREDVLWAYIEEGTALLPDGHIALKCPGALESQIYQNAPCRDGFEVLTQITIPVLVVRGADSTAFPEASAVRAMTVLSHAQLATVSGATHYLPMERPHAVERAVRRFIAA